MSTSNSKQSSAKSYTPEFRIQAIKLAQSQEKSISQTAKDLGVPLSTLHTWVQRAENGEWPIAEENAYTSFDSRQPFHFGLSRYPIEGAALRF